jgi:cell division protein ZapA
MADVRLSISGHEYIVTCQDGEEQHLHMLGKMVDAKAREAGGSMGGLNESRQLLFASLLLADKLNDAAANIGLPVLDTNASAVEQQTNQAVETLEKLAARLEHIAERLEN